MRSFCGLPVYRQHRHAWVEALAIADSLEHAPLLSPCLFLVLVFSLVLVCFLCVCVCAIH